MVDLKHRYDYINDYKRKNYKRIEFVIPKDYYEHHLNPAVKASGMSMTAFIKEALDEKLGVKEERYEDN